MRWSASIWSSALRFISARTVYPVLLILLLAAVAASRIYTREQYTSTYYPAETLLAMRDAGSVRMPSPGYPVYLMLCRGVALLVGDEHLATVVVQVLFSVLAVAFL